MRSVIMAIAIVLGLASHGAAGEAVKFTEGAFAQAQAAGKPILVHVHASWCPTCTKQQPILESLRAKQAFEDLATFVVDFDGQKDAVRALGARSQSTLIVFKGTAERGRSAGVTDAQAIEALVRKAFEG